MQDKRPQCGRLTAAERAASMGVEIGAIERRCHLFVHQHALAAGGICIVPIPSASAAINLHVLSKLTGRILNEFSLTENQLHLGSRVELAAARDMGMHSSWVVASKRGAGTVRTLLLRYGFVDAYRFAPAAGVALSFLVNVLIIEYVGHRLVAECLRLRKSNLTEAPSHPHSHIAQQGQRN